MQNSWKTFSSLADARRGIRGRTLAALQLVGEHLLAGENVEWVSTAEVNGTFGWGDGVVVLSDQRLFVSGCSNQTQMCLMWNVGRGPQQQLQELQGGGHLVRFKVPNMPIDGVALPASAFNYLRDVLETYSDEEVDANLVPTPRGPLELLKQLADLRDAGVLTIEEFEAKKTEVLNRI